MAASTLSDSFRAASEGENPGSPDDEARLTALLERCDAAWPGAALEVNACAFIRSLAQRVVGTTDPLIAAERLAVEDLYLAWACDAGSALALSALSANVEPALRAIHRRGPAVLPFEDFRQTLYEKLFTGDRARIRSYAGRGSLKAWVKIVATRLLSDLRSAPTVDTTSGGHDALLVATMMPPDDPVNAALKRELRPQVQEAIAVAMRSLSTHQRILLRQRYIYGLTLVELARLMQLHRVTVSKQLARAHSAVRQRLREHLEHKLGADTERIDSILQLCVSQVDVRFEELLRSRG